MNANYKLGEIVGFSYGQIMLCEDSLLVSVGCMLLADDVLGSKQLLHCPLKVLA